MKGTDRQAAGRLTQTLHWYSIISTNECIYYVDKCMKREISDRVFLLQFPFQSENKIRFLFYLSVIEQNVKCNFL